MPRLHPRLARRLFVGGLIALLFAVSVGGWLSQQGDVERLPLTTLGRADGTQVRLVEAPPLEANEVLVVRYSLSQGVRLDVLDCADAARIAAGETPVSPLLTRENAAGTLRYTARELRDALPPTCDHATVAVDAPPGAAPEMEARIVEDPFQRPLALVALGGGAAGAIALLAGAVGGAGFLRAERPPARVEGETGNEAFLRLAGRAETWLRRTRAYLLLLGAVGILPWYGLALSTLGRSVGLPRDEAIPLAMLGGAGLVALVGFSVLWWQRYREVDHDLDIWQERLARLHEHERQILDE